MAVNRLLFCITCFTLTLFLNHVETESLAENETKHRVNIILLGATGDLAKRYLWKGFFNLFLSMQEKSGSRTNTWFYGAARMDSETGNKALIDILDASIKCSDVQCKKMKAKFVQFCTYHKLKHGTDYKNLQNILNSSLTKGEIEIGRIFYLSVPPFAYEEISRNIAEECRPKLPDTWMRVVLEKPFGSDLKTAQELSEKLSKYWKEDEIYRIDHYLGKAGVRQIMEFKNQNPDFFDSMWNRDNVEQVKIVVKERGDAQGRMGFYDHYGVIRDVFQNHLTEILVLVASEMSDQNSEKPFENSKKSDLLRTVTIRDAVFGQYDEYNIQLKNEVPNFEVESNTPTFSAVLMEMQNKRWFGVPFILVSGKSLDTRLAYVQIQFKQQKFCIKNNLSLEPKKCKPRKITFYVQGDKLGYPLTIFSKTLPGIKLSDSWENLTLASDIASDFEGDNIIMKPPHTKKDAYSSLICDVFLGSKNNFVSVDDLLLSWKIWSPLLGGAALLKSTIYSRENLENLDFEIVGGKVRFITEPTGECGKLGARKYFHVHRLHSFRGNKLVSGHSAEVVQQLANDIAVAIQTKFHSGGVFHLALSGGCTAKQLFQMLAYMKHIPWENTHIWMVDERCVSYTNEESNFGNMYEMFLKHVPIPFYNIHPMPVDIAGQVCQPNNLANEQYDRLLRYHLNYGLLDFVVLGVGNDGHTASLFPGSSSLRSTNWIEYTTSKTSARMTMTLPLLNQSKNIAVLILGQKKHNVVEKLSKGTVDLNNLPVTALNPDKGSLTWYIDDDALQ